MIILSKITDKYYHLYNHTSFYQQNFFKRSKIKLHQKQKLNKTIQAFKIKISTKFIFIVIERQRVKKDLENYRRFSHIGTRRIVADRLKHIWSQYFSLYQNEQTFSHFKYDHIHEFKRVKKKEIAFGRNGFNLIYKLFSCSYRSISMRHDHFSILNYIYI